MRARTFWAFVGPSVFMMVAFIAVPLASVLVQSFQLTQPVVEVREVESCTAGFLTQNCTTEVKRLPVTDENGAVVTTTTWTGLAAYRQVLGTDAFWRALRFTLTFTLVTLPIVIALGLAIALAVNNAARSIRGQVIFVSLLPFIITPVIGALSIRWLFVGDGILTAALERLLDRDISLFAQGWTIELLMMFYRVWHVAPFAFVVFYAGLQTLNRDTLESAIVDGASRWERLRYVIIPHLMPLIVFVSLIHLMDAYRVFEEVIGFRSEAHVISLQWLTFDYLTPYNNGNRSI